MRLLVSDLLDEIQTASREEFLARHPSPVLVFVEETEVEVGSGAPTRPFLAVKGIGGGQEADTIPGDITASAVAEQMRVTAQHSVVRPIRKTSVNIYQSKIAVGRAANNDVVLPHATVSGFHGFFQIDANGAVTFTDAGSKHGTHVSWQAAEASKPTLVKNGAEVRFGELVTRFFDAPGLYAYLQTYASVK